MEAFFDFIFGNIFLVAVIIGGIISWWRGVNNSDDEKETTRMPSGPFPSSTREPSLERETEGSPEKTGEDRLKEYYEVKKEQVEKNSEDKGAEKTFTYETPQRDIHTWKMERFVPNEENPDKPLGSIKSLKNKNRWDRKRLAEGMVMSEILGPPRAHKPHSSHPKKR
ncbi:hypothetical protein H0266_01425 [Halobacillus locisalis]|uniref:Uncharacterized protein n=1 Tax=Halobacillus locisalis TaxID=220753 RepID=A0A838CNS7_9BACI|nr:hypothetical protein [Halobacillus locisalis]MBA2173553.1 hypothetical protein [Halobacillus locisalis]